ncbi:MAG: hypothetical protein Q9M30_09635, partial [Mariprofundaceae bacterium]|nr:hypothetical protein [Mariprofundaceae bacterium]
LFYRQNRHAVLTSGFEMLLMLIAGFMPLFASGMLDLSPHFQGHLYAVSLQAIPFLILMKMVIRRQPRRNGMLVVSLALMLLAVGISGLIIS